MQLVRILQTSLEFDYVQELSVGSFGTLSLARLSRGAEAGRLVVARRIRLDRLDEMKSDRIIDAAHTYGSISHPSLVKLLGVNRTPTELVWLEEQVIGIPLAKLHDIAQIQGTTVPIDIAAKIILDAVRASRALRLACRDQNLPVPEQVIFPDSVMVANFGEALLAGLGVSNELTRLATIRRHENLADVLDPVVQVVPNNECREIFTAGALLWKLLVIRGLFDDYGTQQTLDLVLHSKVLKPEYYERLKLCAPRPVAQIIRQATEKKLSSRFQNLHELATALETLPPQFLATDAKVREWLSDIAGDYLSDIQRSSGVRRVPLKLRKPVVPDDLGGRPSFIPTPLPGFHEPFIPKPTADTIPSISAPLESQERDTPLDSVPVAPMNSAMASAPKASTKSWIILMILAVVVGVTGGYAFSHQAWIHSVVDRYIRHSSLQQLEPKREKSTVAVKATASTAATNARNLGATRSADGDPAKTEGFVPPSTNSDEAGDTSKSTSRAKRRGTATKPYAVPNETASPSGTNRWGI